MNNVSRWSRKSPEFHLFVLATLLLAALPHGPVLTFPPPVGRLALRQPLGLTPMPARQAKTLEGIVRRTDTGEPIGGVQVRVTEDGTAGQSGAQSTTTDDQGRFAFRALSRKQYTIQAQIDGYFAPNSAGQNPAVANMVIQRVDLDSPGEIATITVSLAPSGVIHGRVYDASNRSQPGIPMVVLRKAYTEGRVTLLIVKSTVSDDQGRFRFWGLSPGAYYLRADLRPGSRPGLPQQQSGFSMTYFPGVRDPERAERLTVLSGVEVYAETRLLSDTSIRIAGIVQNAIPDLAFEAPAFLLVPQGSSRIDDGTAGDLLPNLALGNPGGQFEIWTSRRGAFYLMPLMPPQTNFGMPALPSSGLPFFTSRILVEIGETDLDGIFLTVTRGVDLDVKLIGLTAEVAKEAKLTLRPVDSVPSPLTLQAIRSPTLSPSGNMKFSRLPEGQYAIVAQTLPKDTYVSEIRQGVQSLYDTGIIAIGKDTADPVEVVFTRGGGTIAGLIEDAEEFGSTLMHATLVPQGARRSNSVLYRRALVNRAFVMSGIPPGDYKLFVFDEIPAGADQNEEFMSQYDTTGVPISVDSGTVPARVLLTRTRGAASNRTGRE